MSYETTIDCNFAAVCPCGRVILTDSPPADCSGYTIMCCECSIEDHARTHGFSVTWFGMAKWAYKCQKCGLLDFTAVGNDLRTCKECG